ncbi:upf0187 domain protein membrane protein [Grosmannia clavigera kw1407]|uniref:Upf0187 domain protein membrane protein n=1 Tax=Grosmannia clavigera (strain kw1407 / UAMH 11150) TaxID=655863 RepID=F0XA08_GROCL|nr:upf0187 domain protein membrane protein [Grosmannia clavigera kw1407]EFX05542.1 upf0187 domain protein membrane protein [Grosmannia clavigera kw1407]
MADGETMTGNASTEADDHGFEYAGKPSHLVVKPTPGTDEEALRSPIGHKPIPFSRQHSKIDLDDYFSGPRDVLRHSKWPLFLQMHGSILPKLIVPLLWLGGWATCITCISFMTNVSLGINSTLLTVTGFVVGLALSFRSSTAYERYNEGRKSWGQLVLTCNVLGRVYWLHCLEREEHKEKDVLAKLTAINLLNAFAVALKHKLRHEPYTNYEDLVNLVPHIDTLAGDATRADPNSAKGFKKGVFKTVGSLLDLSFAASNPRKAIKKAHTNITSLNDVLVQTERVLTTPVPVAYAIAINQITWIYVTLLPFQLFNYLGWVAIPGTMVAGYIILGLLYIGSEIENPFGNDVNDLPLEFYCTQIAQELDVITSKPKPANADWIETIDNKVLWPLSSSGYNVWANRGESKLRDALKAKCEMAFEDEKP